MLCCAVLALNSARAWSQLRSALSAHSTAGSPLPEVVLHGLHLPRPARLAAPQLCLQAVLLLPRCLELLLAVLLSGAQLLDLGEGLALVLL